MYVVKGDDTKTARDFKCPNHPLPLFVRSLTFAPRLISRKRTTCRNVNDPGNSFNFAFNVQAANPPTSFPGSFISPPQRERERGKKTFPRMKDPGNEVANPRHDQLFRVDCTGHPTVKCSIGLQVSTVVDRIIVLDVF